MDWKSIIADLQDAGFTQAQLAKMCGCSQPTIWALSSGSVIETRYRIGAALVQMHSSLKRRAAAKRKPIRRPRRQAA